MEFTTLDGILGAHRGEEVARDETSALVDELIEGVLAVGARLAPDDGSGGVVDVDAVAGHVLAVGLHVALLEVGGEAGHVLVVRQDSLCLRGVTVDVHDTNQGQNNRNLK